MKSLKKYSFVAILVAVFFSLNSCGNTNRQNRTENYAKKDEAASTTDVAPFTSNEVSKDKISEKSNAKEEEKSSKKVDSIKVVVSGPRKL